MSGSEMHSGSRAASTLLTDVIPKKVGTVEKSRVSRSNESERRQEQDSYLGEGAPKVARCK
jgi:hypothetical protein